MRSIRSRRVVFPHEERPATVHVADGVIVAIDDVPADIDMGDLAILPGLVDSHVHVNEPGRTDWEGFATATAAAVAGGATTIVDMPLNSVPPTVDTAALAAKRRSAAGRISCDVAFWGGIIPGSLPNVGDLVGEGVCGFKAFTVDSGVGEFPPLDGRQLRQALKQTAALAVPLLIHAEDPHHLRQPEGDPVRYSTYLATRPGSAEAAAIRAAAASAEGDVHILHVAGREAVEALGETSRATAETCPHYLTFAADEIPDGATEFKCAPPIRAREDREALWEALADGTVAMVVSDHSPSPPSLKGGDFLTAWGGIASLELRLAVTWTGAHSRRLPLPHLARWLAESPAALAGLARKGTIAVGADADLVVFDPDGVTRVDAHRLHQRHPITPYDGMSLRGEVVATYLRGRQVHGAAAIPGRHGELLRRGG